MRSKLSSFSAQNLIAKVFKFASIIVLALAISILGYLSFVDNIGISPDIQNITLIACIATILAVIVWEMFFRDGDNKVLNEDINNKEYSVHKRYYLARKGFTYDQLQKFITTFNHNFKEAWIKDIEEITARSREEILSGGYKGNSNKILIFKLKHKMYPKSGIRTPRDMLQVLNVGSSGSMKIDIRKAEKTHAFSFASKIITSIVMMFLTASVVIEMIDGDWQSALFRLLMYMIMLVTSVVTGTSVGIKAARSKLAVAEEICERLEEWKNEPPTEVPYKEKHTVETDIEIEKKEIASIVEDTKTSIEIL